MADVNFRKLWGKLSWDQRASILRERAWAFNCIARIDRWYDTLQEYKKKHKKLMWVKRSLASAIDDLRTAENTMQRLWGIKEDPEYHTYWMEPRACTCPKFDNWEGLGFGRIITEDCPLHGSKPCWKTKGK